MTQEVILHPDAADELLDASAYYESVASGLGSVFLDDFEAAVARISEFPESSPVLLDPARAMLFTRFAFAVVYSLIEPGILLLAIAHERRRPFYSEDRL